VSRLKRLQAILNQALQPVELVIDDESHLHAGRKVETHFKVLVVSEKFAGLSRVDRQKQVNELLADEFKSGLHALSLRCKSPSDVTQADRQGFQSPNCAHSKKAT